MMEVKSLENFYKIDHLEAEVRLWYDVWVDKECSEKNLHDLLRHISFYPAVTLLKSVLSIFNI